MVSTADMAPGAYGGASILVMYGGTQDVHASNGSMLLGDFWAFRFADNTWWALLEPTPAVGNGQGLQYSAPDVLPSGIARYACVYA